MVILLTNKQVNNIKFVLKSMSRKNKEWHDSNMEMYINEVGAILEIGKKVKEKGGKLTKPLI